MKSKTVTYTQAWIKDVGDALGIHWGSLLADYESINGSSHIYSPGALDAWSGEMDKGLQKLIDDGELPSEYPIFVNIWW